MTTLIPAGPKALVQPGAATADLVSRVRLPRVERTPAVHHDELLFSIPMRAPDTVRFRIAEPGPVRIELTALSGRHGTVLIDAPLRAGWHAAAFPESVVPGTYFVRMRTAVGRTSAMMVVTR